MHDETATAGRLISPLRTALAPWFAPTRGAQEFSVGVACAPRRHVTVSAAKPVVGAVRLLLEPAFDVRDGPCEQPARILRQRELDQAAWDSTVEAFQRSGLEPETDRGGWPVYRIQDAGETIVLHLAPDGPQLVRFRGVEVDLATPRLEAVVLEKMIARVCRVALTRDLQDSGWRLLHASALAGPEGAVAFVGAKYAGKTTAMLLGLSAGYRLLTNDQLLVGPDALALGLPIAIHVRASRHASLLDAHEKLGVVEQDRTFSPRELLAALGAGSIGSAPLKAIVALQPHPGLDQPVVTELDATARNETLGENTIIHASPQQTYWGSGPASAPSLSLSKLDWQALSYTHYTTKDLVRLLVPFIGPPGG